MKYINRLAGTPIAFTVLFIALLLGVLTVSTVLAGNNPPCSHDGNCSARICADCGGNFDHRYPTESPYACVGCGAAKCNNCGDADCPGGTCDFDPFKPNDTFCGNPICDCSCGADWDSPSDGSVPDRILTYSLTVGSGSGHRKVGLNGVPMPDSKPQQEGETDYAQEETYVDALTLQLNHSVTDVFVPLASDQLALQVRRNYQQENYRGYLMPSGGKSGGGYVGLELVNPRKAFGACWSSNLECGLKKVSAFSFSPNSTNIVSVASGYREIMIATDENGQSHRFACLDAGKFMALPSNQTSVDIGNIRLCLTNGVYELTRTYGNTIYYNTNCAAMDGDGRIFVSETGTVYLDKEGYARLELFDNGWYVGETIEAEDSKEYENHEYFRPLLVEDRYKNKLVYEFDAGNEGIFPDRIKSLNALQSTNTISDQTVSITYTTNGYVAAVTDPNGHETRYSYNNLFRNLLAYSSEGKYAHSELWSDHYEPNLSLLKRVFRPMKYNTISSITRYDYIRRQDDDGIYEDISDGNGNYTGSQFAGKVCNSIAMHWIDDANGNRHSFEWAEDCTYTNVCFYPDAPTEGEPSPTNGYVRTERQYGKPIVIKSISNNVGVAEFSMDEWYVFPTNAFEFTDYCKTNDNMHLTVEMAPTDRRVHSVVDMADNVWTYTFTDPAVVNNLDKPLLGTQDYVGESKSTSDTVLYQEIRIEDPLHVVECYHFNTNAGMALMMSIDYSGNTNTYAQSDEADYSSLTNDVNGLNKIAYLSKYHRRPTSQTNAMGHARSYTYENKWNQKASITDEMGRITTFGFDAVGNRVASTNFAENGTTVLKITAMEYTDLRFPNFMTKQIVKDLDDPSKNLITTFAAHDYGKVKTKITYPDGYPGTELTTTFGYDTNNNLTSVIDPRGNKTGNEYDAQNRIIKISFFEGINTLKSYKQFRYDLRGNKTWEKDENNHWSHFQYDSRNNCTNTVRVMDYQGESLPGSSELASTNNIVVSSEYNALGMLSATVDARGLRTEFQYDHLQRLTNSIVGVGTADPQETTYAYDGGNCGGSVFSSSGFKPTKVIDPRNYTTETVYDALYRPVETKAQVTNGVYAISKSAYDEVGNLRFSSNLVSTVGGDQWQITETRYDSLNRPYMVINPDNTDVGIRYTSTGLKWQTTNELDRVSTVEYDAAGRPKKTISPEITTGVYATTETGYDANGNVCWVKDAEGNTTTNLYDYRNRVVETIAPAVLDGNAFVADGSEDMVQPSMITMYDNVGNVVSVEDAEGNATTNFYDASNRLVETWAPRVQTRFIDRFIDNGDYTGLYWKEESGVYYVAYFNGQTSTWYWFSPDLMENGVIDTNEADIAEYDRAETVNEFDKGGNITATTDANEKTVRMQYDAFGRLTNTVDAIENTISFEYDANGNQITLTDGNGNTTTFEYDGLNRKTSTIYPAIGTASAAHEDAEYDLIGNRIWRTDCNGARTKYIYDSRNRLKQVNYYATLDSRVYAYDLAGNLTNVIERVHGYVDPQGGVSYTYDALNRVSSETSVGVTHQYKYDLNGNRTNAVYGITGRNVTWSYDDLNRIEQITEHDAVTPQTSRITTYRYDLNSKPVYRQYPSMVKEYRTFDAMGRLLTMTTENLTNSGSFSMAYEYDLVGSALKMVQTSAPGMVGSQDATTTWEYDNRYRLRAETVSTAGVSPATTRTEYDWDKADNREFKRDYTISGTTTSLVSTTTYTNNALNQMTGYVVEVPGLASTNVVFTYDANGNRTNMVRTAGGSPATTSYTYDEDNRLVKAVAGVGDPGEATSIFKYDYRSRRYYRSTPSTPHMYCVFDGGLSIQEYETATISEQLSTSNLQTEFVRGEGMGGGVGGMVYSIDHRQSAIGNIICSHANHRGDVIARSNEAGSLTSFALYEAYGTRPYEWGDDPDRQKANTKEEESDLGLLNEGMRFRDLETGVFLSADPLEFADGPNRYCYVGCNPITKFDPLGLKWQAVEYGTDEPSPLNAVIIVKQLLKPLSSHEYKVESDGHITITKYAGSDSKTPIADALFADIIDHQEKTTKWTITRKDRNDASSENPEATNGTGSDTSTRWNPNGSKGKTAVKNELGDVSAQKISGRNAGIHEAIHNLRGMNGHQDPKAERVENQYTDPTTGKKVTEKIDREEAEVVGLVPNDDKDQPVYPTENQIRGEQRKNGADDSDERLSYSSVEDEKK